MVSFGTFIFYISFTKARPELFRERVAPSPSSRHLVLKQWRISDLSSRKLAAHSHHRHLMSMTATATATHTHAHKFKSMLSTQWLHLYWLCSLHVGVSRKRDIYLQSPASHWGGVFRWSTWDKVTCKATVITPLPGWAVNTSWFLAAGTSSSSY